MGMLSTNNNSLAHIHLSNSMHNGLTQVLDTILPKLTLFELTMQLGVLYLQRELSQVHQIFLLGLRVDQNVIQKTVTNSLNISTNVKFINHQNCCRGIIQSKKHNYICIQTFIGNRISFMGIPSSNSYLLISTCKINTIKLSSST